jgi:hypothetical protein
MPKRWPKIEFIPFTEYRSGLEWGWKIVDRVFRVVEMLLVFGLVNYIRAKTHDWSLVFLEIILALAAILYLLFFIALQGRGYTRRQFQPYRPRRCKIWGSRGRLGHGVSDNLDRGSPIQCNRNFGVL